MLQKDYTTYTLDKIAEDVIYRNFNHYIDNNQDNLKRFVIIIKYNKIQKRIQISGRCFVLVFH